MLSRTLDVGFPQTAESEYDPSGEARELIVGCLYRDSALTDKIALRGALPASISSSSFKSTRSYLGQNIWLIRAQKKFSQFHNRDVLQ